jgi:PmbA protein
LENNHLLSLNDESSSVSFIVEILAEEKTQTEVAWDFQSQRFAKDLDMKSIAIDSAQSAVHALGGKQIPSGKYAVLFSPRVGTQLLHLVTEALSAEAVQRGRSFFS